jgi:hypothetical protein
LIAIAYKTINAKVFVITVEVNEADPIQVNVVVLDVEPYLSVATFFVPVFVLVKFDDIAVKPKAHLLFTEKFPTFGPVGVGSLSL